MPDTSPLPFRVIDVRRSAFRMRFRNPHTGEYQLIWSITPLGRALAAGDGVRARELCKPVAPPVPPRLTLARFARARGRRFAIVSARGVAR